MPRPKGSKNTVEVVKHEYVPIEALPSGLDRWKRAQGRQPKEQLIEVSAPGNMYKRVTDRKTGQIVACFVAKDMLTPATPAEKIDAEYEAPHVSTSYRVGSKCWFVDVDGRWYLVTIVARAGGNRGTITIRSATGKDDTREKDWPFGDLEFPANEQGRIAMRLRPLSVRNPS